MNWIKQTRTALGISTRKLANWLKINQSSVTRTENNEEKTTINNMKRYAESMNCEFRYWIIKK